jgi:hypothetical protein
LYKNSLILTDLNLAASLPDGSIDSFSAASRAAMRAAFFYNQTNQRYEKSTPQLINGGPNQHLLRSTWNIQI